MFICFCFLFFFFFFRGFLWSGKGYPPFFLSKWKLAPFLFQPMRVKQGSCGLILSKLSLKKLKNFLTVSKIPITRSHAHANAYKQGHTKSSEPEVIAWGCEGRGKLGRIDMYTDLWTGWARTLHSMPWVGLTCHDEARIVSTRQILVKLGSKHLRWLSSSVSSLHFDENSVKICGQWRLCQFMIEETFPPAHRLCRESWHDDDEEGEDDDDDD